MDQLPGLLARDFGLRSHGKAAPMAPSTPAHTGSAPGSGSGAARPPLPADLFGGGGAGLFGDRHSNHRLPRDDGDVFFNFGGAGAAPKRGGPFTSSLPVYDKPVYDDSGGDIFSSLPGVTKRGSSSFASAARRDDVFGGGGAPYDNGDLLASRGGNSKRGGAVYEHAPPPYDSDLLGGLGGLGGGKWAGGSSRSTSPPYDDDLLADFRAGKASGANKKSGVSFERSSPSYKDDLLAGLSGVSNSKHSSNGKGFEAKDASSFDDLIPGFGGSSLPKQKRGPLENYRQQTSVSSTKTTATKAEDPFVVFETTSTATHSSSGLFTDPLEHIKPSGSSKSDVSFAEDGGVFANIGFDGLTKSAPLFSLDMEKDHKDRSPLETVGNEPAKVSTVKAPDDILSRNVPVNNSGDSYQNLSGKSTKHSESYESVHRSGGPTVANPYETSTKINVSQIPAENSRVTDEIWLTVSEIPLFTQPTSAPPPSRPPPPPFRTKPPFANMDESSSVSSNGRIKPNVSSSHHPGYLFPRSHNDASKVSEVSSIDELADFAASKPQSYADEAPFGEEGVETTSTAAASAVAMKEAMDRAEAKFKHAREVWERERDLRSSKSRETAQRVRDQDEKEKERLDHEREQRGREEREKEQRRVKKMRELELEREREREKARQAVERANRAARERAAAEARQKAERAAREHAERVAVQRAQAEARERAAAEAKERAEKLAAERERAEAEARERAAAEVRAARERAARERAAVETREKTERAAVERAAAEVRARAQRAAVERAAAEARERAAAEARERAATMAREMQQKNETDLDSFFNMGARANSTPRERSNSYEPPFDTQFQNKGRPSGTQKTSSGSSSITKRPMDDLTSVFRTSPSEEFQEVEGEPEERRRARLEREQRTRQRAAKALAEKNERELQMQRDQAERDRVADSLNTEIRRWAAGKEGNLRSLLSTLQYVLWPDSGWQPVSLTDLITAASVKKAYRKATLCVHPDKVRSGSVQQKYIAEKVFDLLKEAWNKFNSEELF